jgi:hypothetical protein
MTSKQRVKLNDKMSGFRKIYDLHDDVNLVAQVQRATQSTLEFGLVPEHGLFGSHAWWDAVADGRIPTHAAVGRIKRVYMGSMGDWPEFEIDEDGKTSAWSQYSSTSDGASAYVVGRRVRLDYVIQKPRSTQLTDTQKVAIGVWIEES